MCQQAPPLVRAYLISGPKCCEHCCEKAYPLIDWLHFLRYEQVHVRNVGYEIKDIAADRTNKGCHLTFHGIKREYGSTRANELRAKVDEAHSLAGIWSAQNCTMRPEAIDWFVVG